MSLRLLSTSPIASSTPAAPAPPLLLPLPAGPPPTTGRASSPPPGRASSPPPSSSQSVPCRSATHNSIGSSSQLRSTLTAPPRCRERSTTISDAAAPPCMLHHAVAPPILKLSSISDNMDSHAYQSRIPAPLAASPRAASPGASAPPKLRLARHSSAPRFAAGGLLRPTHPEPPRCPRLPHPVPQVDVKWRQTDDHSR